MHPSISGPVVSGADGPGRRQKMSRRFPLFQEIIFENEYLNHPTGDARLRQICRTGAATHPGRPK
jgi:hypothetical protein